MRVNIFLKLLFAAISLAVLLQFVPISDIVGVMADASPLWVGVGVALQFLVRAAASFRMEVIAANQGLAVTKMQLFRILLASQYYSLFLPGILGGGATWVKYLQHGATMGTAAALVVFNRAIGGLAAIGLGACAWLLDRPPANGLVAPLVLSLAAIALAAVVLMPPGAVPRFDEPPPSGKRSLLRMLASVRDRLVLFRGLSRWHKLVVVASTVAECVLTALSVCSFAISVGADVSLLSALWIRGVLAMLMLLPITIAGLGVREATLVGFGGLLGIPPAQAMAWSFMLLLGALVVGLAGAAVESNAASRGVSRYFDKDGSGETGRRADP